MGGNTRKPCILIVDDVPLQLVVLGRILSSDYEVKIAKTGAEAIKIAREHKIELILLDLYMPDMSGFDVLKQFKQMEETKNIPVILITGSSSNEDEVEGLTNGAVDYIRKPFTEIVVKLRVEVHLRLVAQMKIIENLSLTDGLTGISNRRAFEQTSKSMWSIARREGDCFGMLMLDIDKFKNFNDKYGHMNGDICLRIVANTIKDTLKRESDSAFRWGGEEFMVLLSGTEIEGSINVAEKIRQNVAATPINLGEETTFVTISIGAGAICPTNMDYAEDFPIFSEKVNKALHLAKSNGRNRIEKI